MFKRILVPLDGSERAEAVLDLVKAEADHHEATVVLIRIIPPLRQGLMMVPAILDDVTEQLTLLARDYLAKIAANMEAEGLHTEIVVRVGSPAEEILDYAESEGIDLIVIGSHGQSGATRWRFGSVANKIVKIKTSMPVMVINT
jgi:nucleotide-binding universal stress UspA family protein